MSKRIALLAALLLQGIAWCKTYAADRPNFIVINIDDLGYGDIQPYGSTLNRTPNLNRMAEEGRKLTCFYAAPVCSPSRASLMTGCYPKRVLSIPHVLFPGDAEGLDPSEITIAELLKSQGYSTGIIGKWHLGDQPEFLPTRQGFDYYYGLPYSNDMGPAEDGVKSNLGVPIKKTNAKGQPPLPLLRNETVLQRVLPDDQQAIVERYTQEAVKFVWDHQDQPFFLYLPHSAVHFPLYPGKAFHGKSAHGLFGDWVEEVDWSVGQVLDTLRQLNLDEKTLVIFTSDNGGQPRHGAINAPLRGGKGSTLEGGMREPTIAWWPSKIPAGTETNAVTSMMDILPTFVKLAGGMAPQDRKLDGGDIWPILAGDPNAKSPHETFYYYRGLNLQAIRSGSWKLHLAQGDLYNLDRDIGESQDVAKEHPEIVARLRKLAEETDKDLGTSGIGPGCRPLGKVDGAKPLIDHSGTIREGFSMQLPKAGMGVMVGEVTATSAIAQIRLTTTDSLVDGDVPGAHGFARFQLEQVYPTTQDPVLSPVLAASPDHDFIVRHLFEHLKPGEEYRIRTWIGANANELRDGPAATLRTLPGADLAKRVSFAVVTGMNYAKFHGDNRIDGKIHLEHNNTELPPPYAGPDKHLGYPALATIRKIRPNFFVGTGDNVYYDTPKVPRAESTSQLRQKWHEQFVQARYRDLFAVVPTYWMIDDHDYRIDDCDNTGDYLPSSEAGRAMMLEQLPVAPHETKDAKTYRTYRASRDLQIWFPENRMYRSPNAMEDGPEKSIWGVEQRGWLKKTLAESDATFKLLISPNPMIGPDDVRKTDNHTNHGGFRHERDAFFAWMNEQELTKQLFVVCGDRHWQYHSIHPTGVEEFSCGALVDANSRPGRKPGDPASTDPDGHIKQVYSQKKPSGGFLLIESRPSQDDVAPTLAFRFHDEHGELLYEHIKSSDAAKR
ncbi:MAG: sulfatase-like hydrolase/transferase [Planctomycetales bacterium]|nr:sulfatase-like hydrolase/transferase [Planctomycetales bacterium]